MIDSLPVPENYRKHAHKIFRVPAARRLGRFATETSTHDRWLFVIGCYDSGTTLFHELLAQHPAIASLPGEGVFITGELHAPEEFGSVRLIYPVEDKIQAADSTADVGRLREEWGIFLSNDRDVALEKSISNLARLNWLAESFPNSKFVSLVRDGRAVSEGIRRRAGAGAYDLPDGKSEHSIGECARQWVYALDQVSDFKTQLDPSRFMQTSYEAFCAAPDEVLAEVFRFAELDPYSVALPDISNRNAKSIERLSAKDLHEFFSLAGEHMHELGYEDEFRERKL